MSRFPILAILCFATLPATALAQPAPARPGPAPAAPDPAAMAAIQQTGTAFGQCVQTGVQAVPATETPEAGAASVLGGCAPQRQALERAVEALLANLPEDRRTAGRERLRTELGGVEGQIVAAIRAQRAPAAAPAPAPAPAPGN